MPRFAFAPILTGPEISVLRVSCDGCDSAHPSEEHTCGARLWLPTAGRFLLRDADGRHGLHPATAVALPPAHPYTIRHPDGPDTCLSFSGPLIEALVERHPRAFLPDAAAHARILAEVARIGREGGDGLGLAEALCALEPQTVAGVRPKDRDLAEAIQYELGRAPAATLALTALAARVGVSVFHACRAFRRATGTTIQAYRREIRLRLALALLLDSGTPISEIAIRTGFSSQSHLTNRFRERFGRPPGALRA